MNMKLKTLAVAFAALTASVGANAGIVDLFDDGDQLYVDNTVGDGGKAGTTSQAPGAPISYATILGGNRDLIVEKLRDNGSTVINNPSRNASIGVNGGQFDFSTSSLTAGRGQIQWDGQNDAIEGVDGSGLNAVGLGDFDLTIGGTVDKFALGIIFSDAGFNFEVTAYTDAANWTKISLVATSHAAPITTYIPFSAFENDFLCGIPNPAPGVLLITCGGTGADLKHLGALVADIDPLGGSVAIDLTLDKVTTIPEPGALALVALGLIGAGVFRRRSKV
mgnify:FL=1